VSSTDRIQHLQESLNRLVDLLEEQGPAVLARPNRNGQWSLYLHDGDTETPVDLPDWDRMHLAHAATVLHGLGYSIPDDALMATDRHAGWAHHDLPGGAWTAPIIRN